MVDHFRFYDFSREFIRPHVVDLGMPPATPQVTASYWQLYPGVYPPDKPDVNALRRGEPGVQLVCEDYAAQARELVAGGIILQRLMVVHGSKGRDPRYDREYLRISQEAWRELQDDGVENVRLAWYGLLKNQLEQACGADSPLVQAYYSGVEEQDPKASLWAVSRAEGARNRQVEAIGLMNYVDQGFDGVDVWTDVPTELATFDAFWHRVFTNPSQSTDLRQLNFPS